MLEKCKKNKKGQTMGTLLLVFIALLVGVIFLQAIAQQVGSSINTVAVANVSMTTNAVNGTPYYLTDYRALSSVVIYNETGNALVPSTNYTVVNNVVYNGALAVSITPQTTPDLKTKWKISGTAEPLTYVGDSGGRAVLSLIVVMFALALVAVALYPTYEGKLFEMFGR